MDLSTISDKISNINERLHLPDECLLTIKELINLEYLDNEICAATAKQIFSKDVIFFWMQYFIKDPKNYSPCLITILDLVEHWQLTYTVQITNYAGIFLERFFGYLHYQLPANIARRLLLRLQHFVKICKDKDVHSEIVDWCKHLKREVAQRIPIGTKQEMFALLGVLCECYPKQCEEVHREVYRMSFSQLEYQLNLTGKSIAKFEATLVNGLIRCVSGILSSFPEILDESSTLKLFNLLAKTFNPELKDSQARYDVIRAGLELFSFHSVLFIEQIKKVYRELCSRFTFWLTQNNRDLQHFGNLALSALVSTVTSSNLEDPEIVKFFISELKKVLRNPQTSTKQFACAAEAIGELCASATLDPKDADVIFRMLCNKCDYMCSTLDSVDHPAQYLTVLILSISKFLKHIQLNSDFQVNELFGYCQHLWQQFPSQSPLNQGRTSRCTKSLLLKICEAQGFNECIKRYIKNILTLCVSHSAVAVFQNEFADSETTYVNYLPIWKFLLAPSADYANLLLISNEIIEVFLSLISILNLKLNCKSDFGCDDKYEPDSSGDINLFVNFCGLFNDLLEMFSQKCVEFWIPQLLHTFIAGSRENPLISGWYKLLSKCLTIMNSLKITCDADEIRSYANYLSNLSHGLLDETQVAAIQCLFSMPSEICSLDSVFNLALNLGKSHSALADIAINSLNQIPQESIPCLNFYLGGKLRNQIEFTEVKAASKSKRRVMKPKHLESSLPDTNSEKVAFWLGSNDQRDCIVEENALRGCNSKFFLNINFPDMSLRFPVHKILPRVIDLCRFSESRRERVTACEVLHAIILIGLPRDPVNILRDTLTCVFKLACEIDLVIVKLFSSLVTQLINWLAPQPSSDETSVLLEQLLSAAVDPHLPNLRQFAAKSFKSYILVCLKKNSNGLRTVVKRLCSLLLYPSSSKQLGICLTLRSCHKIFASSDEVFSTYVIQILWSLFQALLTSRDPEVIASIQETLTCYSTESFSRYDILCQPCKMRLIPSILGSEASIYQLLKKCVEMVSEANVYFTEAVIRAIKVFYNKFTSSEINSLSNVLHDINLKPKVKMDVDDKTFKTPFELKHSLAIPDEVFKFYYLLTKSEAEGFDDLNIFMLKLKDPLDDLLTSKFSVLSSELIAASPQMEEYCQVYRSMLSAFGKCCESSIFEVIMKTAVKEKQHVMDAEIERTLKSLEGKIQFNNKMSLLIETCFGYIFKNQSLAYHLKENICEKFLCPLLNVCNLETLKATIGAHLESLLTLINSCKTNLNVSVGEIIMRKISFQILCVAMNRLPKEELHPMECYLNSVFASISISNGRSLAKAIIESCRAIISPDSDASEDMRQLVCAAYNCIIFTVSKCLNELKYFESFIFSRKFANLNRLVNPNKVLKFPFDTNKSGEIRKTIVSLRSHFRTHTSTETQLSYLSSQYLRDSSLRYETTAFDLTDSQPVQTEDIETKVEISMDDLGSHDCFLVLVDALSHLLIQFSSDPYPRWLELLVERLNCSTTHLNLKLLILKVFCSLHEQLAPFSRFLILPIVNVLISHINFIKSTSAIVVEFISMIFQWSDFKIEKTEERSLSILFDLLIVNAPAPESRIFRNNFQLIKLMLEKFKDSINIPFDTILTLAKSSNILEQITSVQTFAALFTNRICLSNVCNYDDYYSAFGKLITSKKRNVYQPVAELFGMVLKHHCSKDTATFKTIHTIVNREIQKLSSIDSTYQFVTCICKISERCPQFGDEYVTKVLSIFANIHGEHKFFALKFLRLHASQRSSDILRDLKSKGLLNLVRANNDLICFEILEMLEAFLPHVEIHLFSDMFNDLDAVLSHHSSDFRLKLYEIYMWIFEHCPIFENRIRYRLLMGLVDKDTEIVDRLIQFFSNDLKLGNTLKARFQYAFSNMYDVKCEHMFLHYTTRIIFELASHSNSYNDPVTDRSLGQCFFEPLKIIEEGKHYFAMTPRFVETQFSSLSSDNLDGNTMSVNLSTSEKSFNWTAPQSSTMYTQSSLMAEDSYGTPTVYKNVVKKNHLVSPTKSFGLYTKFFKHSNPSHFIDAHYNKEKLREKQRRIQKFERENYLNLHRSYRQGDLPDVQISFKSIIQPLVALSVTDAIISRIVFSQIAIGIHDHISSLSINESDEWENFLARIINLRLESTTTFNKPFIWALLEIACNLSIPPDLYNIRCCSILSGLHLEGIYCLETLYMKESSEEILNELCYLYIELNKYDFIKGLCHGEYAKRSVKALQLQSDGDLVEACKEYNTLLSETESLDFEAQRLFWNAGLRQCLYDLNSWKALGELLTPNEPSQMRHYVEVNTRLTLMSNGSQDFANEIPKLLSEPHFAFSLSRVVLAKGDFDNAQRLNKLGLTAFFSDWNLLDTNLTLMRKHKLDDLVSYYEMCNFLKNSKNFDPFCRRLNKFSDDLRVWDDVFWARKSMCINLQEQMHDNFVKYKLDYAAAARIQNRNCLAKRLLREIHSDVNKNKSLHLFWLEEFIEVQKGNSVKLCAGLESLLKLDFSDNEELKSLLHYSIGNAYQYLANSSASHGEVSRAKPDTYKLLSDTLFDCKTLSEETWVYGLQNASLNEYQNALDGAFDSIKINESLSQLCNKLLLLDNNDFVSQDKLCKTMICSALSIIRQGGPVDHWPRLLQLLVDFPDFGSLFKSEVKSIPCWMFLSWIDQTVACLAGDEGVYVQDILQDIGDNYPQALIYALTVSTSGIVCKYEGFVKQLHEKIRNPNIQRWLDELERLNCFHITLDCWMKNEFQKLKGDRDTIKMDKFKQSTQLLYDKLWEPFDEISESRKRFAKTFRSKFEALLGDNGVAMKTKQFNNVKKLLTELIVKIRDYTLSNALLNMKDYSPWMNEYFSSLDTYRIELPGQYNSNSRPILENHVYVEGFDANIKIMSSLRRPKRITIIGSDANEYKFLVKAGEDLRQDSRIIKLFTVMNQALGQDSSCRELSCYNHTYNVIPMTEQLGLIEWCPNTEPLKCYLENAAPRKMNESVEFYQSKVKDMNLYIKDTPRAESIDNLCIAQNKLGRLLLRNTILNSAASNECFILMREKLVISYATLCACHYFLGIGDRHTSNMLLDVKYLDKFIGIDFGHAFESATLILPIPEMVPFRLTCQLENIIAPHTLDGMFHATLSKLIHALRKGHDRIMDCLQIFLKERLVDWASFARMLSINSDTFLKDRIDNVRLKFCGVHPCKIFLHTFLQSRCVRTKQPITNEIRKIVKGSSESRRTSFEYDDLLSEAEQATCLIDLATDEYLLSKTWKGWSPYV